MYKVRKKFLELNIKFPTRPGPRSKDNECPGDETSVPKDKFPYLCVL